MITAHVLVKNEENFIWYSVMSVIEHIDSVMIWDTGSTDKTLEIIKEIIRRYPKKVSFKEIGEVDENQYSKIRQAMFDETKSDWFFILDGDEIWWESSIKKIINKINLNKNNIESIVVPTINLIGDMYHYQEKKAGKYNFGNKKGHYALRFINKNIPGLHVNSPYGKEGYFDDKNQPIQNRSENKILFMDAPYIHTTHLVRSSEDHSVMQRIKKIKNEIGIKFTKDFYYPEVFFKEKPSIIPNIWNKMNFKFWLQAFFETPIRKIKRRIRQK